MAISQLKVNLLVKLKTLFLIKKSLSVKRRNTLLYHKGDYYNLLELYNEMNAAYFSNKIDLSITWFGDRDFLPKRRITLGSYHPQKRLIKIHRILDQPHIPLHYISFIVYHEMLHHEVPPIKGKRRRRRVHHSSFKEREKQFADYALADAFDKEMKERLFKSLSKRRPSI